jgi:hypothetical protein
VARIEEQVDYGLHFHMFGWIDEVPTTQHEIQQRMKEPEYARNVFEWLDSVRSYNSPILEIFQGICPHCDGLLESIDPSLDMFQKGNTMSGPPLTCKCGNCGARFSSYQLNLLYVDKYAELHGIEKGEYSMEIVDSVSASFEKLDIKDPLQNIVFTTALLNIQFHYWHHANSCFKKGKRTPSGKECIFC